MSLLLGVRWNDTKDAPIVDPSGLVAIHDDPDEQADHCIRREQDDFEDGDTTALAACRAFILDQLAEGGLFADTIEMSATERVPLYLAFRHQVEVDLPRFAFRLGRAIHALEDGYAHTLRNPTTGEVRHVNNWIDFSTRDDYEPARDGYPHLAAIDDCLRNTEVERYHLTFARQAVADLLDALRDPSGDGAARRARVETVLDRAFAIEPGCTHANRYCSAGELGESAVGCSASRGVGLPVGLVVLGLVVVGGRRRGRHPDRARSAMGLAVAAALLLPARGALAQPEATRAPDRPLVWHGDFRFGAALDHAALAFVGGVGLDRYNWTFGLAVEWNPWFSLDTARAKEGALNIYATLARRWYDDERFTLYSRAELGTSTILFDLVGVDEYDTGVYFGGSLLGVAIKKRHGLRMTLDPSHFAMPTPRPSGLPFYWRQYRISIGLELRFE